MKVSRSSREPRVQFCSHIDTFPSSVHQSYNERKFPRDQFYRYCHSTLYTPPALFVLTLHTSPLFKQTDSMAYSYSAMRHQPRHEESCDGCCDDIGSCLRECIWDECCPCSPNCTPSLEAQAMIYPCIAIPYIFSPPRRSTHSTAYRNWSKAKSEVKLCWVCIEYLHLYKDGRPTDTYPGAGSTRLEQRWELYHPFGHSRHIASRAKVCASCLIITQITSDNKPRRPIGSNRYDLLKEEFGYRIDTSEMSHNNRFYQIPIYVSTRLSSSKFPHASNIHMVSKSKINMTVAKGWYSEC